MESYGFTDHVLSFLYSYLKRRKQSVNNNNVRSMFQILLSGVPQEFIIGPLLLNIFVNDLFYFITDAQLLNFTFSKSVDDFITELRKEYKNVIDWCRTNEMVVNPDRFQL